MVHQINIDLMYYIQLKADVSEMCQKSISKNIIKNTIR